MRTNRCINTLDAQLLQQASSNSLQGQVYKAADTTDPFSYCIVNTIPFSPDESLLSLARFTLFAAVKIPGMFYLNKSLNFRST